MDGPAPSEGVVRGERRRPKEGKGRESEREKAHCHKSTTDIPVIYHLHKNNHHHHYYYYYYHHHHHRHQRLLTAIRFTIAIIVELLLCAVPHCPLSISSPLLCRALTRISNSFSLSLSLSLPLSSSPHNTHTRFSGSLTNSTTVL